MSKPRGLAGRTIVVTRPRAQSEWLARRLADSGARVVCAPVIKIVEPSSYRRLDAALRELSRYDAVVFTSQNAVERFFERARTLRLSPLERPRGAVCFAVGAKTAAALRRRGWPSRFADEGRGEALARALPVAKGARVLIPRAREARPELPAILRRRGAKVTIVEAYRTVADERAAPRLRRLADAGRIDAVTFTSESTAKHLGRQLGRRRFRKLFGAAVAASIGPVTTRALKAMGARRIVQPARPSQESLDAALRRHFSRAEPA